MAEQLPDRASLLKQIAEHQEAYCVLYERNVRLSHELHEAKQTIELLSAPVVGVSDPDRSPTSVDLFPNMGWQG